MFSKVWQCTVYYQLYTPRLPSLKITICDTFFYIKSGLYELCVIPLFCTILNYLWGMRLEGLKKMWSKYQVSGALQWVLVMGWGGLFKWSKCTEQLNMSLTTQLILGFSLHELSTRVLIFFAVYLKSSIFKHEMYSEIKCKVMQTQDLDSLIFTRK